MATKKKAKSKAKSAKKTKKKSAPKAANKKKAARKPASKKTAAKKSSKAKPKAATAAAPPGEQVGTVVHYYGHLSVAIIRLDTGTLRVGDVIHIKGHTSDFRQPVESMEIDHVHVNEAGTGQTFGLRVKEHARENDVVYKVAK